MKIVMYKNRGAAVSNPEAFKKQCPDAQIVDIQLCLGLTVLNCTHNMNSKPGSILAKQWLFGKGSRLKNLLTAIPCPTERREAFKSVDNFRAEFERACNPRKIGLGNKETRLCNIL